MRSLPMINCVRSLGSRLAGFEYLQGNKVQRMPMVGRVTVNSTDGYRAVLSDYPAPPLDVSLLYAGQRHLPLRVRVFMDWLAATLHAQL